MADPLSVISAIASVIQLIDFSTKLLSRLNEYRSKGNELPASFTHIDRQLPLLREILEQSKLGIESQSISDREVKAITPCLKGCGEQIGKLNNILDKIVPELQENVVKRMAKGLRSVWKESEVRDIDDRIGEYVKILSFYCAWSSSKLDSRNDKTRAKAQAWLAAPDPYFNLRRALKLRTPNTGDWYLQGAEFQTWKAGVRPFTWLYGAAGSGKSILSAGIIDYLQGDCSNDPAKTLAFWFFDFNDSAKQDPSNMLRSLVSQLLNGCAQVPDSLQSLHTTCENLGRSPSTDDLLLVLKHALERLPTPFIVLDALDECTNRASLFEFIEEMHSWNIAGARVLMTSRKEIDIEEALEDVVPQVAWVGLESNLVDRDIETFRWAGCQLDVLAQCTTKGKVRRALKELPKTLDETYDRIVRSIEGGENAQEAIKILTWLAYSGEPLDNGQLLEVTGIMLDDEPRFDRDEVLTDPRDLLRICSSLVRMTTLFEYDNHHYEGSDDEKSDDNDSIPDMEGGTDLADGRHEESGGETTDERSVVDVRSITQRRQHVRLAHFSTDFETTSDEHCGGSDMEETAIVEDDGLSVAEQRVAPDTSAAGEDLAAIPLDGEQPSPSPDHQQHNKAQIATDIPQSRNLLDYETNIGIGDNAKHKFNAELPFDIYMMTHHTPLRSTRPSPTHAQATKPPTPADNATNAVTILQ
ncbi:hypothetical protein B0A48_03995 [Cryoendolithus antarcticus]|uniref:NACHT domain-containing protein n=1 Tax=Cryoendolithus antarcticus TaxID=1507870 RepID=A0A1V8TH47_9PEZI|nr:hypothetical protein B0A48_03995 [Cryoendolithus antarcticus]